MVLFSSADICVYPPLETTRVSERGLQELRRLSLFERASVNPSLLEGRSTYPAAGRRPPARRYYLCSTLPAPLRAVTLCAPVEIGELGVSPTLPLPHLGVVPTSARTLSQDSVFAESGGAMQQPGEVTFWAPQGLDHKPPKSSAFILVVASSSVQTSIGASLAGRSSVTSDPRSRIRHPAARLRPIPRRFAAERRRGRGTSCPHRCRPRIR